MSNEMNNLWKSMHKYELEVFPLLKKYNAIKEIEKNSNLEYVEIMRALQWLENKKLIQIKKEQKEIIILGKNGLKYKNNKLPEIRFIENIILNNNSSKELIEDKKNIYTIAELKEKSKLENDEFNIVLGLGRRLGLLIIEQGKVKINKDQIEIIRKQSGQHILEKIESGKHKLEDFDELEKHIIKELQKRKNILSIEKKNDVIVELTDLGKELILNIPRILMNLKNKKTN